MFVSCTPSASCLMLLLCPALRPKDEKCRRSSVSGQPLVLIRCISMATNSAQPVCCTTSCHCGRIDASVHGFMAYSRAKLLATWTVLPVHDRATFFKVLPKRGPCKLSTKVEGQVNLVLAPQAVEARFDLLRLAVQPRNSTNGCESKWVPRTVVRRVFQFWWMCVAGSR